MYLLATLELLVVTAFAFYLGALNPPAPRSTRQSAQQQQSTRQINQQASVSQSNQPRAGQTDRQEQAASQNNFLDWLPEFIVGLLTVGIGYLQWQVMQGQKKVSETQSEIAERQNTIIATQTTHMESGLRVAQLSAEAAKESADTASRALIIANPPKIIIRDVRSKFAYELANVIASINSGTKTPSEAGFAAHLAEAFKPEEERSLITGSLTVMNKGKFHATVVASDCMFMISNGLPPVNPCDEMKEALNHPKKLGPGQWARTNIPEARITAAILNGLVSQRTQLYVIGLIVYVDDLGNLRKTGFRRWLDPNHGRFVGQDEPDADWEYQD